MNDHQYTDQEICQIIQDYDRIIQELRYGVEAFVRELVSLDSNDDWLCSLLALQHSGTGSATTHSSLHDLSDLLKNKKFKGMEYASELQKGINEYLETLCRIPDTVRSMVETFKNATAMTSMPDMSGAVRLEDITSCAEGCIALEKAMELPGNIKQAKKAFYGDTALIEGADTTACMQLENMDSMYYGCVALASVQIPDSAKELSNICNGCVNLKEVHIPSSAQKMNSSFFGCTALESITGEIPSSCTDSGNLFSGCKFLSGTLTVSCTSKTTLSSSFSDAATAGTGLTIILRYDAEKSQETANTGFYGGTKSADEILNALKASMEAAFSSGSHITITTNADKTEG